MSTIPTLRIYVYLLDRASGEEDLVDGVDHSLRIGRGGERERRLQRRGELSGCHGHRHLGIEGLLGEHVVLGPHQKDSRSLAVGLDVLAPLGHALHPRIRAQGQVKRDHDAVALGKHELANMGRVGVCRRSRSFPNK